MIEIKIKNQRGEILSLTNNPGYTLMSVDGMNPAAASINTSENAVFDGSMFLNSRMGNRNIVISFAIEEPVAANRIELYRYIKSKMKNRIYIKNGLRDVYIDGYVETFDISFFEQKETVQISYICPSPYFIDVSAETADMSPVTSGLEFPLDLPEDGIEFSEVTLSQEKILMNNGDAQTGAEIIFHALGTVGELTLYNLDRDEHIKVNEILNQGDTITVNTNDGKKSIIKDVGGVKTNAINSMERGSSWIRFDPGRNRVFFTCDVPENCQCFVMIDNKYEGV